MSLLTYRGRDALAAFGRRVLAWLAVLGGLAFALWLLEDMRFLLWLSWFFL